LLGLTETSPLSQIVAALTPHSGKLVLRKRHASAFFETGVPVAAEPKLQFNPRPWSAEDRAAA